MLVDPAAPPRFLVRGSAKATPWDGPMITAEAVILIVFSLANACRLLAYLPQIATILRDNGGARAVSCATWILFFISNGATAIYAAVVSIDFAMAAVFSANTLCCATIVLLVYRKRRQLRRSVRTSLA